MSTPTNCLECEHRRMTAHGYASEWGLFCYADPGRVVAVKALVRHDGRIIAPEWCPLKEAEA